MADANLRSQLILSAVGFVVGLLSGAILAVINVITPYWVNKPLTTAKYVEAIPIANYNSFDEAAFSAFARRAPHYYPGLEDSCARQLSSNRLSSRCGEQIAEALSSQIHTEEATINMFEEWVDKVSKLDFRQVSELPPFQGDETWREVVYMMNIGLGLARSMEIKTPDDNDIEEMIYHFVGQSRSQMSEEVNVRRSFIVALRGMRGSLDRMDLTRENGKRTGEVYFKIGIQNSGHADALIPPAAKLYVGQSEIPLVPRFNRNAYTIIPPGRISEVLLEIDRETVPDMALKSWTQNVVKEDQEDFQIIFSDGDNEFAIDGRLPITEDVADEVVRPVMRFF